MTERVRSSPGGADATTKPVDSDLGPKKTALVLVIVVGCFGVLWPKIFYPMIVGSANQRMKPSPIDKTTGCCDVISEIDVNTIKILSELCGTITPVSEEGGRPLTAKETVQNCRQRVLDACGIDISIVLQEQVRLGQNVKQILDEIRSLNGSLCLKYNFGVPPWRLGVPHRITVKTTNDADNIRQERPMLRSEMVHPAFRERGRAIPQPPQAPPTRPPKRIVEGRPGPVPGMRPTIGGAGHVVPPSKQGTSSMSVIMPIYTIGIVIFFTYTLMKIIFKKQPDAVVGSSLYPPINPDPYFRKEVFDGETSRLGSRLTREAISNKLVVNAMSALLDEVDQELEARRKINEVPSHQDLVNGNLSNGDAVKPQDEEEQPTVKVLGMETTASCEGGKKWSRPESPIVPTSPSPVEPPSPPQEIYLEGALPPQSQLLVADSAIEPEPVTGEDPAVVLSGKMTLSVISPESEDGITEETHIATEEKQPSGMEQDIEAFLEKLKAEAPTILLESEDNPQTLEVENLEKEVDELIREALDSIKDETVDDQIKEAINTDIKEAPKVENETVNEEVKDVAEDKNEQQPKVEEEIEELVEEIEEIVYEIESGDEEEEEIEIEVEESDDDDLPERYVTESTSAPRMNGDRSTDPAEESKYTTVSGGTAAENDISDEELIDEEVEEEEEEEEEIIELDEEAPNNKVNNISGDSDQDL